MVTNFTQEVIRKSCVYNFVTFIQGKLQN